MNKHIFSFLALVFVAQMIWAIDPSTDLQTYYASADGKVTDSNDALRVALHNIIKSHTTIGYGSLQNSVYAASSNPSDFNNGSGNTLEDIYSSKAYVSGDNGSSAADCGGGWNKEHTIPQSWFNGGSPMYSDAHHIFPTDIKMNSTRSNYPFGENNASKTCTLYGYGHLGSSTFPGYSGTVFDPGDPGNGVSYKGDIARVYFYMVTCYRDENFTQDNQHNGEVCFTYSGGVAQLTMYMQNLLLKWHREDPVSEKELVRNNAIHAHQGNRNPFVDFPCLAEYIWGEHKGETLNLATLVSGYDAVGTDCCGSSTAPAITSPKEAIDLGTTDTEHTATKDITIMGVNLEDGNLTLALGGANVSYFSLAATTVTKAQAENGYNVTVSYAPAAEGNHTAILTISGCGITNHTVQLTGKCTQVHTVVWIDDQTQQTTMAATGDYLVLPANQPADCSSDRVFVGWTAQSEVSSKPLDLFTEPSGSVFAPATYYAVYADKTIEGGGVETYELASSIASGDKVIIACNAKGTTAGGLNTSYLNSVSSSFSSNYSELITIGTGTLVFTVGGSAGAWTLTADAGVLGSTAAKSVNLSGEGKTTWNITFSGTTATIASGNTAYGTIQYNNSSPRFTTYTSTQTAVQLYKATGGTTITYSDYSLHCDENYTELDSSTDETIARKVLIGGHIYLQIGEQLFTITGQRVK